MNSSALISIVDDDASAREGVTDLIETFGFGTRAFPGAEAFLKSDQVAQTACLIVDMQMPGMTGLALYNELVASGHAIPTVLITAFPDESVRRLALRAGIVCYLVKPFVEKNFIDCIRSALSRSRGARPHAC